MRKNFIIPNYAIIEIRWLLFLTFSSKEGVTNLFWDWRSTSLYNTLAGASCMDVTSDVLLVEHKTLHDILVTAH